MESIANRVGQVIEKLGISKNEFAREIGISSALISKITNKETNFGVDVLSKIVSKYPAINPYWVLTGVGEMFPDIRDTSEPQKKTDTSNTVTLFNLEEMTEIRPLVNFSLSLQTIFNSLVKGEKIELTTDEINGLATDYAHYKTALDELTNGVTTSLKIEELKTIAASTRTCYLFEIKRLLHELEETFYDGLTNNWIVIKERPSKRNQRDIAIDALLKAVKKS